MLINCVAYQGGAKLAELSPDDPEELARHLAMPDTFVWVALRDADEGEIEPYLRLFNLHALAVEDASKGHQRPKAEEYGSDLFVVMHLVDWVGGDISLGEVAVFVGHNYVLSVRSGSKVHFLGVRERCEREPELLARGPSYVLYALMDAVVDRYFPIVDLLESELEEIEQSIFVRGAQLTNITRLYELKRRLMLMRRAVAPTLEMLSKLHGGRIPPVCHGTGEYFRDVADHLARIEASIESVRDTLHTAIQANLSMVAIDDSAVTKKLAAWAGIFAAATAFAGIWGMNFQNMPELKLDWGYPVALGIIASVCVGLWWRFKRAGWL
jgi:magnesium transporter